MQSELALSTEDSQLLKNSAYFQRCYDVNFALNFSLEKKGLTLKNSATNSGDTKEGSNKGYRDFSCADGTKDCLWFREPEQVYCRKIKECQICSLSIKCVYQTEISMCVSTKEVEDLD